jgi:hypothetical protein
MSFELITQFERHIAFDCHSTQIAYRRSETKRQLVAMGPSIFPDLVAFIRKHFPNMATSTLDVKQVDWDKFGIIVWLICDIRDSHGLPPTPYYGLKKPFKEQDMQQWHDYCLQVASPAPA